MILSKRNAPILEKRFLNWTRIKKIAIVTFDNQLSYLVDFINSCENNHIQVNVFVIYNGKPEFAPKPQFNHIIITKDQYSIFQLPKDSVLQSVQSTFDVLINLGTQDQIQALSLSKLLPCHCRIANFENQIFDISIQSEKMMTPTDFLQQVIVYLNMIKTTK
ncbi:MAG: hypothetical protein IT237_07395 [Bacteroidia bacterium]|nr:hypothetical protein [Bacteroidia bacterium]